MFLQLVGQGAGSSSGHKEFLPEVSQVQLALCQLGLKILLLSRRLISALGSDKGSGDSAMVTCGRTPRATDWGEQSQHTRD